MLLDVIYENGTYRTAEPYVPDEPQKVKLLVPDKPSTVTGAVNITTIPPSYYPLEELSEDFEHVPMLPEPTGIFYKVSNAEPVDIPPALLPAEFFE